MIHHVQDVPLPSLRVDLVEGDRDHVLLMTRAITQLAAEAQVRVFPDGMAAWDAFHSAVDCPDLILLDINLAGMSGLELLAHVKEESALRRIPVIMLTSSALADDIARVRARRQRAHQYAELPARSTQRDREYTTVLVGDDAAGAAYAGRWRPCVRRAPVSYCQDIAGRIHNRRRILGPPRESTTSAFATPHIRTRSNAASIVLPVPETFLRA